MGSTNVVRCWSMTFKASSFFKKMANLGSASNML